MTEVQYRSGGEAPTYPLFGKFGFQTIFWANRALIAHDRFQQCCAYSVLLVGRLAYCGPRTEPIIIK